MPLKKFFSRKKDKKKDKDESDPWAKPKAETSHSEDPTSFIYYVKDVFGSFGRGFDKRLGRFGYGQKYHIRFMRKTKRTFCAILFFLYSLLAFVSISNPPFFFLFLGTAYLLFDYLWKTRRISWEKKE